MNNVIIKSPLIIGNLSLKPGEIVQISIVAYEHQLGLPARFCAGLIPAIELSKRLKQIGFTSIIRVIDPTPIANYCNGWQPRQSQFQAVIAEFFNRHGVDFFFDEAEPINQDSLEVMATLGAELNHSSGGKVADIVQRIKTSGKKHGGTAGANNATVYMAAHPFSWLDMHHPLIWKRSYPTMGYQFVNLMSQSEERFAVIRKFLRERRPDLCTKNNPTDRFMTICKTPCYIPLEGEPLLPDLTTSGHDWCHERYYELRTKTSNHDNALKDFETLMSFLGLTIS